MIRVELRPLAASIVVVVQKLHSDKVQSTFSFRASDSCVLLSFT